MTSVTVLYLAGHGRSGSTLVERLVAARSGSAPSGELVHLWQRGLRDDERCGCGAPFSACPFWAEVGERAFGGWDRLDPSEVLALQDRVDHTRLIPAMLMRRLLPRYRAVWQRYGELLVALYRALRDVTGSAVVLDSSKHLSTAYLLATTPGVDLRVVHLVRDVRGVAWSWGKTIRKPEIEGRVAYMPTYRPSRVAARWLLDNLAVQGLRALRVPVVRLHYEAVVAAPERHLTRVLAAMGLPDADAGGSIASRPDLSGTTVQLSSSHTVAGNPSRFQVGPVALRLDDEWRDRMPRGSRAVVTGLTWPLLLAYGYLHGGRDRPTAGPAADPAPDPGWVPSVSVVIPTRDRPELLARAVAAVRAQDYPGPVECLVVYDQSTPDPRLHTGGLRPVRVLRNGRRPGLAGARNAGALAATGDLVAFCDDDDEWAPGKLTLQVAELGRRPDAEVVVSGVTVRYGDRSVIRVPSQTTITLADLLRSRIMAAHPSTFLVRRRALCDPVDGIGLVDEQLPGSYAEDYEWLLRAARRGGIAVVRQPLVTILWHASSFFTRDWATIAAALRHLLRGYPEFAGDRRGAARIHGQIAFAEAAQGRRAVAARSALRALVLHPAERRGALALLVAAGVLPADMVLRLAHARGRGI